MENLRSDGDLRIVEKLGPDLDKKLCRRHVGGTDSFDEPRLLGGSEAPNGIVDELRGLYQPRVVRRDVTTSTKYLIQELVNFRV